MAPVFTSPTAIIATIHIVFIFVPHGGSPVGRYPRFTAKFLMVLLPDIPSSIARYPRQGLCQWSLHNRCSGRIVHASSPHNGVIKTHTSRTQQRLSKISNCLSRSLTSLTVGRAVLFFRAHIPNRSRINFDIFLPRVCLVSIGLAGVGRRGVSQGCRTSGRCIIPGRRAADRVIQGRLIYYRIRCTRGTPPLSIHRQCLPLARLEPNQPRLPRKIKLRHKSSGTNEGLLDQLQECFGRPPAPPPPPPPTCLFPDKQRSSSVIKDLLYTFRASFVIPFRFISPISKYLHTLQI